jgi:hypothetical protein
VVIVVVVMMVIVMAVMVILDKNTEVNAEYEEQCSEESTRGQ